MRSFHFTFSIWTALHWRENFRRSWKTRRYWLALPATPHTQGRATSLQLGPVTFRVTVQLTHRIKGEAHG